MSNKRSLKHLMFNEDVYTKRDRPYKTLIEQVLHDKNMFLDEFCRRSINERVWWSSGPPNNSTYFWKPYDQSIPDREKIVNTDFFAIAQKAPELFLSACAESSNYRCTGDFECSLTAFFPHRKKVELFLLLWLLLLRSYVIQSQQPIIFEHFIQLSANNLISRKT